MSSSDGAGLWVSSSRAFHEEKAAEERARSNSQFRPASSSTTFYPPPHHLYQTSSLQIDTPPPPPPPPPPHAPLKISRSRHHTSILCQGLSLVHVALCITAVGLNSWVLEDLDANPLLGPGVHALTRIGATSTADIVDGHQYWRLLVSPFLSAGVLHACSNISAICTFSMFLSNQLPMWQIALLYMISGISSVTTSANIGNRFITAAGSGPAFGLIGASCVLLLLQHHRLRLRLLSWLLLGLELAVMSFIGATPFVDNSGNTAGFASGALAGCGLMVLQPGASGWLRGETAVRVAAVSLLSAAVSIPVLGVIGLNAGLPLGGCCNVWVCAPSSWWDCTAAYAWQDGCVFTSSANGTVQLACPQAQGRSYSISTAAVGDASSAVLQSLCSSFCSTQQGFPPAGGYGPQLPPAYVANPGM